MFQKLLLSNSFCQFLSQHSDGSHYVQAILSFHTKFEKKVSLFLQIHLKKTLFVKTTASLITRTRCGFLPACKFYILLLGNFEELPKNLDTFSFTYQHVDCLCTFFKYRFNGKVIAKSGQVFDSGQRAVDFNHRNKVVDRMPSIAKKNSCG